MKTIASLGLILAMTLIANGPAHAGPLGQNLLVNPGAEESPPHVPEPPPYPELPGWTIMENGGYGWASIGESPNRVFATSWLWDTRYQEVDLIAAGFTEAELDDAPPIAVGEWITDVGWGGYYFVNVELRDASHNVIATWQRGTRASPVTLAAGTTWFEESHTFMGYGSGVRYVYFADGGKDAPQWGHWYGPRFDNAMVQVLPAPYGENLLTNPGAEESPPHVPEPPPYPELPGWTIVENAGYGWASIGVSPDRVFATSWLWNTRYQEVDLMAAGFTEGQLDDAPAIEVGEWLTDVGWGGYYYITVDLLDAGHNVLATWQRGTRASPITLAAGTTWFQESHIFTRYGSGVRYIRFEDGGKDAPQWGHWYGPRFDDAMVRVLPPPLGQNLLINPGAEESPPHVPEPPPYPELPGWTIVENGGYGWASIGESPNRVFATSHEWDTRYQEVDLIAVGFTEAQLDWAPPIAVGEWITDVGWGGYYFINVELRDENHNVLATWQRGTLASPITLVAGTTWFEVSHTFMGYGSGVRYVRFGDGGKDAPWWGHWYGPRFDDAMVQVLVPRPGDVDGDGDVDLDDFSALKNGFGTGTTLAEGDFDGDGDVDLDDFAILKLNFGRRTAP